MEVPVFHHPCGKREVRIGLWGRELRHPDNCPLCRNIAETRANMAACFDMTRKVVAQRKDPA